MAKTSAATVTPLRPPASDSAGISPAAGAGLLQVQLDALAPHPHNRTDLGDLTELAASIQAQGLFEPLNVLTAEAFTAAAERDGDPERPGAGITHVIVMGHRRAAGAQAAGLDTRTRPGAAARGPAGRPAGWPRTSHRPKARTR